MDVGPKREDCSSPHLGESRKTRGAIKPIGRHRGLMMLLSLDRQVRVHADPLQARDRSRAIEAMGKIG